MTKDARITFYAGVNEIGGNKFLVEDKGTRIFLDFGMQMGKANDYFAEFLNARTLNDMVDLFEFDLLPKLNGLYRKDYSKHMEFSGWAADDHRQETAFDAVLLTHAHVDHAAHIHYLRPDIPIYCSEANKLIMQGLQDTGSREEYVTFKQNFRIYKNSKGEMSRRRGEEYQEARKIVVFEDRKKFKINLIMAELCHNAKSLKQVLKNATRMQKKVRYRDRIKRDACIVVNHYLAGVFPQGQDLRFAQRLEFNGNNNVVINLNHFPKQIQTLVIGSVAYEILKHQQEAVLVVPDGWTMFDLDGAALGRFHVELLISEGSQNRSYVVIESGFIGDILPHIRRQMSTILLGYQLWGEEARDGIRALRNLAKHFQRSKPMKAVMEKPLLTRFDIQKLKVGEFQAFPSYLEEMGVWRVNKISTTPPQASSGEAIAHS